MFDNKDHPSLRWDRAKEKLQKMLDGVDTRLHLPLLAHSMLEQTAGNLIKVTIVYRALELGMSVFLLGLITATFAIMPAFLAIPMGRFMDRGHDSILIWFGSTILVFAALGFLLVPPSVAGLFLFTALYGIGHMCNVGSSQIVCVRSASSERRDFAFGNYMIANSVGHALGPLILSFSTIGKDHPPTDFLFLVCLVMTVCGLMFALMMRPAQASEKKSKEAPQIPMAKLIGMPGIPVLIGVGIITMTAVELAPVYLPVLGLENGISAFHIGLLLTARSIASLLSRIFYAAFVHRFGRKPMFITTLMMSTIGIGAFALPLPLFVFYFAAAMFGFGIGFATTLSVTSLVNAAPSEARATVVSIRMFGNRMAQITLPALAGAIASATGAAGVFAIIAVAFAIGTYAIRKDPKAAG